jgi:hypothetical protein
MASSERLARRTYIRRDSRSDLDAAEGHADIGNRETLRLASQSLTIPDLRATSLEYHGTARAVAGLVGFAGKQFDYFKAVNELAGDRQPSSS